VGKNLKVISVVGLVAAALAVYFVFFRSSAPASVDSVAAAEARQEAIAAAAADSETADAATVDAGSTQQPDESGDNGVDDTATDDSAAALDSAQPDSAASIGAPTDGVWSVDSSIGTFDQACLTDVCGSNFAGFRIDEELANFGAKTVVGRTPNVTGSMELSGTQVIGAEFTVDMTTLITDNDSRTSALSGPNGGLETATFPLAQFELTTPIELGEVPAEGVAIQVNATGNLTVHGVTNEVTIPLTAELQAGVIAVFGNLEGILLSDYDIPKPTAIVVVSVEDNATLELQLFFGQ